MNYDDLPEGWGQGVISDYFLEALETIKKVGMVVGADEVPTEKYFRIEGKIYVRSPKDMTAKFNVTCELLSCCEDVMKRQVMIESTPAKDDVIKLVDAVMYLNAIALANSNIYRAGRDAMRRRSAGGKKTKFVPELAKDRVWPHRRGGAKG